MQQERGKGNVPEQKNASDIWGRCLQIVLKPLKWLLLAPIWFYQHCISPFTPASCRFTPTCSEYMRQAIVKHGPLKGLYLGIRRILRCHPWGGSGYDPVP